MEISTSFIIDGVSIKSTASSSFRFDVLSEIKFCFSKGQKSERETTSSLHWEHILFHSISYQSMSASS